jgi:predicted PurR-regulated permease PerM
MDLGSASRWGLNVLALLGAVLALHLGHTVIIPTIIALLLAAMLWPAVRWMHQGLRLTWGFACMVAVMGLVVLNLLVSMGFFLAIPKLLQDLPDLRTDNGQREVYTIFREQIGTIVPLDEEYLPPDPKHSRVFQYVKDTLEGPYIPEALLTTGNYGVMWLWEWMLVMFLLLFMLLEGPMLSRRVVEIFGPSADAKDKAVHALSEMARSVRTYLVWRTIINFGVALLVGIIYQYLFHLKQPWTWAILTAVLFYVPYLGPLAAGLFPVLDAFFTVSPWASLALVAVYIAILIVEGYFLVPVVMGHSMQLNATTVMLACLFWDLVWGLPGLFLAMPLMAAIKAICTNVPNWQPWANLMSTPKGELAFAKSDPSISLASDETQVLTAEEIRQMHAPRRSAVE